MRNLDDSEQARKQIVQPVSWAAYPPEDEISLIDIWRVLSRRRWWIVATFAIFLAAGLAYALLASPSYEYTTVINVGTRMDAGGNTQPLASPDALTALATNAVIPTVLGDYAKQHADDPIHKIEATHPKDSNLVVLSAEGPTSRAETFKTLQQQITQQILAVPMRHADTLQQLLNQQAESAQARVKSLQDSLDQLRGNSASNLADGTLSMQRSQTQIDLAQAQAELAQKQGQIAAFTPPQVSATAVQSQEPTGLSRKLIVVMAAILGLFAGIVLALFADFVSRANAEDARG